MRNTSSCSYRRFAISPGIPRDAQAWGEIVEIRFRLAEQQLLAKSRQNCFLVIGRQGIEDDSPQLGIRRPDKIRCKNLITHREDIRNPIQVLKVRIASNRGCLVPETEFQSDMRPDLPGVLG